MTNQTYKKIELTGSSTLSVEDAISSAIEKAAQSVRQMRWFEVTEIRGAIKDNIVHQYQVTIKVGFSLED